jgi:acyl carrier protein
MQADEIFRAVYEAIDQINRENPDRRPLDKGPDTPLYGSASDLDSLGLINLVVSVEQNVEKKSAIPVSLVDDRALSQEQSPFLTVQTLVDYIEKLLKDEKDA